MIRALTGPLINFAFMFVGSLLGLLLRKGLSKRFEETIMQGLGLATMLIGITMGLKTNSISLVLISLVIGGIIGEAINIEKQFTRLGDYLRRKLNKGKEEIDDKNALFTEGFVFATLITCIGAMAIVGSLESGLNGDYTTLFAKSIIDGVTVMFLSASMGLGVLFSSFSVLFYEGLIALMSTWVEPFLSAAVISEISATGGLLIFAAGLSLAGIAKLKAGNLLPSIFIAAILAYFIHYIPFL